MKLVDMEYRDKYIDAAIKVYKRVLPELKNAVAGEYPINKGFRLLLQEYQTKVFNNDAQIEWHRKNHDVFIVVDGEELAFGIEQGALNLDNKFDEKEDIGFVSVVPYKIDFGILPFIKFGANDVLHFEPNDLHISQIAMNGKSEKVKKCCFKIVDGHNCNVSFEEIEMLRKSLEENKVKKQMDFDVANALLGRQGR
ncbi:MAG: YhcH/YjgK/YiaL family protein [Alphaproteobacteria bacterium]